jgi:hypothetical protein
MRLYPLCQDDSLQCEIPEDTYRGYCNLACPIDGSVESAPDHDMTCQDESDCMRPYPHCEDDRLYCDIPEDTYWGYCKLCRSNVCTQGTGTGTGTGTAGTGRQCARASDCPVGLNCRSNVCTQVGGTGMGTGTGTGTGEQCARTSDCPVGLNCRSNVCTKVH